MASKVNLEVWNTADNLNNCKEFALTARVLRDHFTTFMKSYKSKQDEKSKVATSWRPNVISLKKMNVEPKEILKKDSIISKTKNRKLKN